MSTKKKLYLAGPMRGKPGLNFDTFYAAAADLRKQGYLVFNPAENPSLGDNSFREYMKIDLPAVMNSDAVVVLPGWEKSKGASLEVHVAHEVGLPVWTLEQVPVYAYTGAEMRRIDTTWWPGNEVSA